MKASLIRIVISIIALSLFISLIFFHNTSIHTNENNTDKSNKISRKKFNPIAVYDSINQTYVNQHQSVHQEKIATTSIISKSTHKDTSSDSELSTINESSDSIEHGTTAEIISNKLIELQESTTIPLSDNSTGLLISDSVSNHHDILPPIIDKHLQDSIPLLKKYIDSATIPNSIYVDDIEKNAFNLLKQVQLGLLKQLILQSKSKSDLYIPSLLTNEESSNKEFQFDIIHNFHKSLKYGSVCNKNKDVMKALNKDVLYQSIEGLLSNDFGGIAINTIIEYGYDHVDVSTTISYALARSNPLLTAILLRYKQSSVSTFETNSNNDEPLIKSNCDIDAVGSNLFLTLSLNNHKIPSNNLPGASNQQFNCIQTISDFDLLVSDLLPFEYEASLADILCQCNITYLPNTLPVEINPYFAFWESATHLVDSARLLAKKNKCTWSISSESSSSSSSSYSSYSTVAKTPYIIIRRNITYIEEEVVDQSSRYSTHKFEEKNSNNNVVSNVKYNTFVPISVLMNLPLAPISQQVLWSSLANYLNTVLDSSMMIERNVVTSTIASTTEHWLATLVVKGSIVCNVSEAIDNSDTIALLKNTAKYSSSGTSTSVSYKIPESSSTSTVTNSSSSSNSYVSAGSKYYSKYHYVNGVLQKEPVDINNGSTRGSSRRLSYSSKSSSSSSGYSSSSSSYSSGYSNGYSSSYSSSKLTPPTSIDSLPDPYDTAVSWDISDSEEELSTDLLSTQSENLNNYDSEIQQYISELSKKSTGYVAKSNLAEKSYYKYYSAYKSSSTSTSDNKYSVSAVSRTLQRHLYIKEKKSYQKLLQILDDIDDVDISTTTNVFDAMKKSKLIYIIGKHISLFSLKLSKKLLSKEVVEEVEDINTMNSPKKDFKSSIPSQQPLVVSLLSDSLSIKSHRILTNIMELKNNIIGTPQWNLDLLTGLVAAPERGDYSIIQVDVVIAVITSVLANDIEIKGTDDMCINRALLMEQSLSILLSLSSISYIEVPSLLILQGIFQSIIPSCAKELTQRYKQTNILELGLLQLKFNTKINIITKKDPTNNLATNVFVQIYRIKIQYLPPSVIQPARASSDKSMTNQFALKHSEFGLSLYTALQMGIIKQQKKLLLKILVSFPLWSVRSSLEKIASWNLFIKLSTPSKSKLLKNSKLSWSISYHSSEEKQSFHIATSQMKALKSKSGSINSAIIHSRNHQSYTENIRLAAGVQENNDPISDNNKGVFRKLLVGDISEKDPQKENIVKKMQRQQYQANEINHSPLVDRRQGQVLWKLIENELYTHKAELAEGKFSFIDHNSGYGYFSLRISKEFQNATVISLERDAKKAGHHVSMIKALKIHNNAVCLKTDADDIIHKNIYESPELFRFQLLSNTLLDSFIKYSVSDWGLMIGTVLSTSLTTFIYTPLAIQVSWAMFLLYGEVYEFDRQGNPSEESERRTETQQNIGIFQRYYIDKPFRPIEDIMGSMDSSTTYQSSDEVKMIYELNFINKHPQYPYKDFEGRWLLENAIATDGHTSVQISPLSSITSTTTSADSSGNMHMSMFPLVRCDIVNMTRHVHHHYEYSKDGHTRTYTMEVLVNDSLSNFVKNHLGDDSSQTYSHNTPQGHVVLQSELGNIKHIYSMDIAPQLHHEENNSSITTDLEDNKAAMIDVSRYVNNNVSKFVQDAYILPEGGVLLPLGYRPNQHKIVGIHLYRDKDSFPIPYTSIYGVTLITTLRLGLESTLRDELFESFLAMPLYEDMAPWNVVLMGSKLDYIDYDTKEFTFNDVVPKAYQIMSVLMNYKRTVEDFQRCGSKSATVYGLPYVSDCVGTNTDSSLKCPDLKLPVPCADGLCHTDYISCLQGITELASKINNEKTNQNNNKNQKLINDINTYKSSLIDQHFIAAMKSIIGKFDQSQSITKSINEIK